MRPCGDQALGAARSRPDRARRFPPAYSRTVSMPMGPCALRQLQQRPVAARDHIAAPFFLDGGKGQVEMKKAQRPATSLAAPISRVAQRRVHAVSIRIRPARHWRPSAPLRGVAPVASTMAPDGRLSPAGGMTSPGRAVTTNSAMPGNARASSAPSNGHDRAGLGKGITLDHRREVLWRQVVFRRRSRPARS